MWLLLVKLSHPTGHNIPSVGMCKLSIKGHSNLVGIPHFKLMIVTLNNQTKSV